MIIILEEFLDEHKGINPIVRNHDLLMIPVAYPEALSHRIKNIIKASTYHLID